MPVPRSNEYVPTVYVVQDDPRKNFVPALDFGRLEVILPERSQVTFASSPTVRRIRDALYKYTAEDFILANGDPVAIGIVCAEAARRTGGVFQVLKWDRQEMRYYADAVDLNAVAL